MTDDRIPPHDLNAEMCVLGAMMLAENVMPEVFGLIGEYDEHDARKELVGNEAFFRPAHGIVYAEIVGLFDLGVTPDAVLVANALDGSGKLGRVGGLPYLLELIEAVPTTANAGYYAKILRDKLRARRQRELAENLAGASPDQTQILVTEWLANDQAASLGAATAVPSWAAALTAGGGFVLDVPTLPPAIWGNGEQIGWADGEALMLCGPPGVGKTTLVQQLVEARLGISKEVLGMAVQPGAQRVLYLAMDRPPQIARAMARLFRDEHREVLNDRLIVWKGPPPADLARHPDLLAEMCAQAQADTVIVDSLKDAVLKLSDDESGSGYNRARQQTLVKGVQVVELHHQRKAGGENKKPSKLDDVYGSVWLTAGAGSVFVLWGESGDPLVELLHLKQPMEPVGPWRILHDHATGRTTLHHQADLLQMAHRWQPSGATGLTAKAAACAMFSTEKPTPGEVEKARRKLDRLVSDERLVRHGGVRGGGSDRSQAAYFLPDLKPLAGAS